MLQYLLKRIFLFLPTLLAISLLAFGLSRMSNRDPVANLCIQEEPKSYRAILQQEIECRKVAANLGFDKPTFYVALRPQAYPDTLYRIYNQNQRVARQKLIAQYGNWPDIQTYFKQLEQFKIQYFELPDSLSRDLTIPVKTAIDQLGIHYKSERIDYFLNSIEASIPKHLALQNTLNPSFKKLATAYQRIQRNQNQRALYLPTLHWYGLDNQYHRWISAFVKGDFGVSYYDDRPVSIRIWEALRWTLILNLAAIFFAYLISIPLGVFAASKQGTKRDQIITTFLFMLYALPSFWLATMLIVFFTTSEYGMDFFPTAGLGSVADDAPFWTRFWDTTYHFILPVFCLTYAAFAFISRQMRGAMLDVLEQDYMMTAKAKGLKPFQVIWKHGFRNALFPIITLFASILPSMLAGSVIIEVIFSIPGMGRLAYDSLFAADWPIVFTILMFAAILTMLGNLIADVLYALADPRVQFDKK